MGLGRIWTAGLGIFQQLLPGLRRATHVAREVWVGHQTSVLAPIEACERRTYDPGSPWPSNKKERDFGAETYARCFTHSEHAI